VEPAYAAIAAFQEGGLEGRPSVTEMLQDAAGLREHQELFEITVSEFLPLTRCQVCGHVVADSQRQQICPVDCKHTAGPLHRTAST